MKIVSYSAERLSGSVSPRAFSLFSPMEILRADGILPSALCLEKILIQLHQTHSAMLPYVSAPLAHLPSKKR